MRRGNARTVANLSATVEVSTVGAKLTRRDILKRIHAVGGGRKFFPVADAVAEKIGDASEKFPATVRRNFLAQNPSRQAVGTRRKNFFGQAVSRGRGIALAEKIICSDENFTPCRPKYDLFADKYFLIVLRE